MQLSPWEHVSEKLFHYFYINDVGGECYIAAESPVLITNHRLVGRLFPSEQMEFVLAETTLNKGPWTHRFLVNLFTVVLTILAFWLLGFVLDDISTLPGPDYSKIEQRLLDQALIKQATELAEEISEVEREIKDQQDRQHLLRDSTDNSLTTMNEMLKLRRLSLEKEVAFSEAEQDALAEAEKLFLVNQQEYQTRNEQIAGLNENLLDLQQQQRELNETLQEKRQPVHEEYQRLERRHDWKMAALKLAVLIPLLLVTVVLFLKKRNSVYISLLYAFGIALLLWVGLVMHEHFPTPFFKYVLIVTALAMVIRILVALLRMVASPGREWLLKQYREAYETFLCPICDYPIRRGPLKYLFWTRRSIKKQLHPPAATSGVDESYTCPMCATRLYEECEQCHAIRHSLLPACSKCGGEKSLSANC